MKGRGGYMFLQFFFRPSVLFSLILFFIFAKIYEHNRVINLIYEKQRLEKTKNLLLATKNRLLAQYLTIKNYKNIHTQARDSWNMKPVDVDHVVTLTTQTMTNFFTSTTQPLVQKTQNAQISYTLN